MSFENIGFTAEQSARLKENADTEGFRPLVLEALDGKSRPGGSNSSVKPFKVNTPTEPGTPGIHDWMLHRKSEDGGQITYDRAGNAVSWESQDKKTKRTYIYHDTDIDRAKLYRINGAELYQDKNGTYFQYKTLDGVKKPVAKLFTKAFSATAFADIRGATEDDAMALRAVDKNGAPVIVPIELKDNLKISATLDQVKDNHGHVWKRDEPGKPLTEYVTNAKGKQIKTKHTATDADLLPQDLYVSADRQKLYNDASKPLDSIKAFSVEQTELGDCYFEGPLAEQALQDPKRITAMIHDNHDGTVTVKYPLSDPTFTSAVPFDKRPTLDVTVEAPTPPEMATFDLPFDRQQKNGYWSNVMEKAHRYLTGKITHDDGGTGSDSIQLLSGVRRVVDFEHPGSSDTSKGPDYSFQSRLLDGDPRDTKDAVADTNWLQEVKDALAKSETVVAKTIGQGNKWVKVSGGTDDVNALGRSNEVGFENNEFNILDGHCYSVVKVDGDNVTLRNPLAFVIGDPAKDQIRPFDQKDDGYFTVSSADFQKFFAGFFIN